MIHKSLFAVLSLSFVFAGCAAESADSDGPLEAPTNEAVEAQSTFPAACASAIRSARPPAGGLGRPAACGSVAWTVEAGQNLATSQSKSGPRYGVKYQCIAWGTGGRLGLLWVLGRYGWGYSHTSLSEAQISAQVNAEVRLEQGLATTGGVPAGTRCFQLESRTYR
jgi:hypothetical protein